jgi:signal transduction histidine kinase
VRDKLFAAFQSAARPGGTGLGLAIAAELVRAHGGEVWLAHTGADGTAFHFTVPDRVSALRSGKRGAKAAADA